MSFREPENFRYEDYLKKKIQTKLSRDCEIERISQLGTPTKNNNENNSSVLNIVAENFKKHNDYREPVNAAINFQRNSERLRNIEVA